MFYTVEYYTYLMVSQRSKLIVSLSSALYMQVPLKTKIEFTIRRLRSVTTLNLEFAYELFVLIKLANTDRRRDALAPLTERLVFVCHDLCDCLR